MQLYGFSLCHVTTWSKGHMTYTVRKTTFSFSRRPEKMVFPKKSRWNMIFLVLLGKMIFLFPENMILPPDGKWKIIFLKKIHGNMIFSSNVLKRWSFQKGLRWDMIFLVLSGKVGGFFSRKRDIFSLHGKWERERWRFSRNTRKHDILYLICYTPPCQKEIKDDLFPQKIHLKVIDILDRHLRKSSSNSLYLHGDLYRRFHILLSSEKKQGT